MLQYGYTEENKMSTATSYPIRLEKKLIEAVRSIAKREGRTIKAQLERMLRAVIVSEANDKEHVRAHSAYLAKP